MRSWKKIDVLIATIAGLLVLLLVVLGLQSGVGRASGMQLVLMALLSFALAFLWVAFTPSRLRVYVLRLMEQRAGSERSTTRSPLLRAGVTIVVAGACELVIHSVHEVGIAAAHLPLIIAGELLAGFAPLLAMLTAVALHFRPNVGRDTKYVLILTAVGLHASAILRGVARKEGEPESVQAAVAFGVPMLFLAGGIVLTLVMLSTRAASVGYRATRWPVPFAIAFVIAPYFGMACSPLLELFPLVIGFLTIRYVSAVRMAEHPILFFRSFANSAAGDVLARVVAPVASRFGVVRILVHRTQPGSEIAGQTSTLEIPTMDQVGDKDWQEHVKALLERCGAVILDMDGGTGGLDWELKTSIEMVGHERVIVLSAEGAGAWRSETEDGRLTHVRIGTDPTGVKAARQALRAWLRPRVYDRPLAPTAAGKLAHAMHA